MLPKAKGELVSIMLRLSPEIVKVVDEMAEGMMMSRNQLLVKLLTAWVKFGKDLADSDAMTNLFSGFEDRIEGMIEQALKKATHAGGVDLALYQARQMRRAAKKLGRK